MPPALPTVPDPELAAAREAERQASLRLADAVQGMPDGFVLFDADDRLVMCNERYRELYDRSAAVLVPGARFEDILRYGLAHGQYPEAAGREEAWLAEALRVRQGEPGDFLRELPDDRWLHVRRCRTHDHGIIGIFTDVTAQVQRERALDAARAEAELAQRLLREAVNALPAGVEVYDAQDRLVVFNEELGRMYPHVLPQMQRGQTFEAMVRESLRMGLIDEAVGREDDWLRDRLAQRGQRAGPLLQRVCNGRWVHIYETRTPSGTVVGVRLDVSHVIAQQQAIEAAQRQAEASALALREANARLEALSETDALTGLANRRCFDRRLREEWERAARHQLPLALLMIDVDHFKLYNDRHGHQAGDDCLRRIAAAIAGCAARRSDLAARYGGEEFVVLLPHSSAEDARQLAQRCAAAVDALADAHGASPVADHVTLSIGLAMARTDPGADPTTLLRDADDALYEAKQTGRHRVSLSAQTTW